MNVILARDEVRLHDLDPLLLTFSKNPILTSREVENAIDVDEMDGISACPILIMPRIYSHSSPDLGGWESSY